jgi:translation elongation factor EF-G
VRATIEDAAFTESGQPEIAINSAASHAFREALRAAGPVVVLTIAAKDSVSWFR